MSFVVRSALAAVAVLVSACASEPPPPPPISAAQFATYKLVDVAVNASEAEVIWAQAERDFAASKGLEPTAGTSSFNGGDDDQESDEDIAAFAAYDAAVKSDEAKEFYRERAAAVMQPRLAEALTPAFKGEKPLKLTLNLSNFSILSSGAVALGGDEGVIGAVDFVDAESGESIATSPGLSYVSRNNAAVVTGGGLAGFAIGLAVSAAVNAARDAIVDSSDDLSRNYAQSARGWMQLEPYEFPEK